MVLNVPSDIVKLIPVKRTSAFALASTTFSWTVNSWPTKLTSTPVTAWTFPSVAVKLIPVKLTSAFAAI